STPTPLTVQEIVARSTAAVYHDMGGVETQTGLPNGQRIVATTVFTLNPERYERIDQRYDAQGNLINTFHVVLDGITAYSRNIQNTTPPQDSGWQRDPRPAPAAPQSVLMLNGFSTAILIATETNSGVNTYHLRLSDGGSTRQVWIRTDNFYLAQYREESPALSG